MDAAGPTSPLWGSDVAPRLRPSRSGSSSLLDGQDLTVNSSGRGNAKGAGLGNIGPIGGHRGASAVNRAISPALSASGGLLGGGDSHHHLGASYHSFRAANSSSPSFASAFTHQQGPSDALFDGNGMGGGRAGTPRLVLESAEGATKEVAAEGEEPVGKGSSPSGSEQGQGNEAGATPRMGDEQASFAGTPRADSNRDNHTPVSATSESNGISAGMLGGFGRSQSPSASSHTGMISSMSDATAHPSYPFPAVSRPTALNATTLAHNSALASFPSGFNGVGFLGPPSAGIGQDPTSPTAATAGGAQSATFSPFGSPSKMALSLQSFTAAAAARQQRSPQPHQPPSRSGSGSVQGLDESSATAGAPANSFDAQLRASPLINDLIDRLVRLELSVKDVNRHVGGINRNVSILLDRTKHLQGGGSGTGGPASATGASGSSSTGDDIRLLSSQVNTLTSSVAQLLALQASNAGLASPVQPQPIHQQLAGLGLGATGTPQLGGNITTPSLGTLSGTPGLPGGFSRINNPPFDRAVSPGLRGSSFSAYGHDPQGRLSPRPGGGVTSPNPQARLSWGGSAPKDLDLRRWNASGAPSRREGGAGGVRGTPDVDGGRFSAAGSSIQGVPAGAMAPPDPGVIVTKWDHLNLHPDLLRSILKYGLGPPNKIQQRALPFLLRGSDIIAQAPPTQERIASYVIPALQVVLNVLRGEPIPNRTPGRGPIVIMISTTVDQATQAQRMALGLGANLGVRVHIAAAGSIDVGQEAAALVQAQPHIVIGTPQKMSDLFTFLANRAGGAICLGDVRLAILDEVDQLIARNLADYVSTLLRLLPPPRVALAAASGRASLAPSASSHGIDGLPKSPTLPPGLPTSSGAGGIFAGFENDAASVAGSDVATVAIDRQTAIFSNTVPQDVLNFAQSIHLRESVRVLVRRDGNAGQPQVSYGSAPSTVPGAGHAVGGPGAGSVLSPNISGPGQYGSSMGLHGQPANALGASPANNNSNPLADPMLAALRGLRQYYVYVAVSTGGANGMASPNPMAASSSISHAVEMKLDVITDLLEDIDFGQAVIYTSSSSTLEAVTYKLASKGVDALALHKEMAHTTRQQVLAKFRSSSNAGSSFQQASQMVVGGPGGSISCNGSASGGGRGARKALVVYDVPINPRDVHQVPLIVFYDLPRSVDDYKEKLSCAAVGHMGRPSVCVNVVTGSGGPRGDIEMLRTLECHLGCKMAELPMNPSQILQF